MRIALDHQTFCNQGYGGISRYFVRLAGQLGALGEDVRIFAPLHRNRYAHELAPGIVRGVGLPAYPPRTLPLFMAANRWLARSRIRNWVPDIVHETYYSAHASGPPESSRVITVYDMIHERFPENFPPGDPTSAIKRKAIERADHVICISANTRSDLIELFGVPEEKVSYVHLGFEEFPDTDASSAPHPESGRPYLLFVGGRYGYKNFDGFLRSAAASPRVMRDFGILAFGGGRFSSSQRALIKRLGFEDGQVRQVGGGDIVLAGCYRGARALVYPSLYEGFGLPPLEAMSQDCPVISSDTSSMPEVVGDAAEYFDPGSIEDMTRAIESVAYSDGRTAQLKALGRQQVQKFSWRRCAEETLAIYGQIARNPTGRGSERARSR